jgi:penicillin-binding protein 1A
MQKKRLDEHLKNLQKEFFKAQKDNKNAPFVDLIRMKQTQQIMQAMKISERWRLMDLTSGKSEEEIIKSFDVPAKMKIFTYEGEKDTIMKPTDSIIYYKHMLQTGMMAMEPRSGHIKAWVGGVNYKFSNTIT